MDKFRENLKVKKERAVLVGAKIRGQDIGDDLAELKSLTEGAGAVVVDRIQQKLNRPSTKLYIGKGKAEHLAERVKKCNADVVIFDNDLSPRQIRELEKIIDAKIIDRSELILDIFASRAQTKQAKLQVSLAQLEYTYPRLARMWSHLDTVAGAAGGTAAGAVGGIGTRGTGEQQLEIDRRLVQKRITEIKRQLANIDRRKMREINGRKDFFKVCLVGYTNAGKSTLLNALTKSAVYVEDKLFATLDTRTCKWTPENGVDILLSDTVGFVRNLPHHLVASFKATLEEVFNADLLVHVIDVANKNVIKQVESVDSVLGKLNCEKKPQVKVFNKIDNVMDINEYQILQAMFPEALSISAKSHKGLESLNNAVANIYKGENIKIRIETSSANGKLQSFLRSHYNILSEEYHDNAAIFEIIIGRNQLSELKKQRPEKIEMLD
ncbi:MAG: GTPase HflX [Phycisphaerae bacterium]|nr:GTPase HflX [Phycisphaerae bacterium]